MGQRGPLKLSKKELLARGSCRTKTSNSTSPDGIELPPKLPKWLNTFAAEIWNEVVPVLVANGQCDCRDQAQLARYCILVAQWRGLAKNVETLGTPYEIRDRNGLIVDVRASTLVNDLTTLDAKLSRMETNFGMNPEGRRRIKFGNPGEGKNKNDEDEKRRFLNIN